MQGTELLKNPDFQRTLERSPFQERDLPGLASAVSTAFERLTPEQRKGVQEAMDQLRGMTEEQLRSFMRLLMYVEANPDQYPKFLEQLVASGDFDPEDMPQQYDPRFFAIMKSMVGEALQQKSQREQGFAKGGIVSLRQQADRVRAAGRKGDSMLAHITPFEANALMRMGGGGTINPKTGLPEFGLWDTIKGVLKIGAQILGTAILTPFVGPIAAGAIVGGVSSLLSGGNAGDALKSAVFGGITGGLTAGVSSALGGGGFFEGAFSGGSLFGGGQGSSLFGNFFGGGQQGAGAAGGAGVEPTIDGPAGQKLVSDYAAAGSPEPPAPPGGIRPTVTAKGGIENLFSLEGAKQIWSDYKLPIVLGGGAALIGLSKATEGKAKPPLSNGQTGSKLLGDQPDVYGFKVGDFQQQPVTPPPSIFPGGVYVSPSTPVASRPPTFDYTKIVFPNPFDRVPTYAKAGGHIAGPGTGTSDSIPARLSDGEFVMTARAVRGAGDGDRMKGARKMYELMHKFERMA